MESEQEKHLVRKLAHDWAEMELPAQRLTYSDYIRAISRLHKATKDTNRTEVIVAAIISQARKLGKSSEWVQVELQLEEFAEYARNRPDVLLAHLKRYPVTDSALDLYNVRKLRFSEETETKTPVQ